MKIEALCLGELETNCYVAWDPSAGSGQGEAVIIDPGFDGGFISEKILAWGLRPLYIVLTHGHFDHVLGCLELKLNFRMPILIHKADEKLYLDAPKSAKHWLGREADPVPKIDGYIKEGEEVVFGSLKLKVLETPGHTPGSICLYDRTNILFSGDTLFKNGVGRTDFKYSRPLKMAESLERLRRLPVGCLVYPGHGEATTINDESRDRGSLDEEAFLQVDGQR